MINALAILIKAKQVKVVSANVSKDRGEGGCWTQRMTDFGLGWPLRQLPTVLSETTAPKYPVRSCHDRITILLTCPDINEATFKKGEDKQEGKQMLGLTGVRSVLHVEGVGAGEGQRQFLT